MQPFISDIFSGAIAGILSGLILAILLNTLSIKKNIFYPM